MERYRLVSLSTARAVALGIVALTLGLYVISLPYQFRQLAVLCVSPGGCISGQLLPQDVQQLQQAGLSLNIYAGLMTGADVLFSSVWLVVAGLIFWRRAGDVMALFTALMLAMFPLAGFNSPLEWLGDGVPAVQPLTSAVRLVGQLCIVLFFFLFPDGKFTPRWTAALLVPIALREALNVYAPQNQLADTLFIYELVALMVIQVYRYRRHSNPMQRQQTKWVVFGSVAALGGFTATIYVGGWFFLTSSLGASGQFIAICVLFLWLLLLPLSIGMAILRSHLWDIDLIIRRTLVYGVLMVLLGLVYAGTIIVLQTASHALTGVRQSPAVVVLSTLAIIRLFDPLRRRIQRVIDRRFFRSSYNAEQVLARFRAAARTEVALDHLSAELLGSVEEALHPQAAGLWVIKKG